MLTCGAVGALLAGLYGVIHDQVTFTISPEYFTNLKFKQFAYADFGFSSRVFVSIIGFLATWWLGLFVGWCFARRFIPDQSRQAAFKNIRSAFLTVLISGVAFAFGGYIYGYTTDPQTWVYIFDSYDVTDGPAFMKVAYVHIGSYIGGLFGLIAALIIVQPRRYVDADH